MVTEQWTGRGVEGRGHGITTTRYLYLGQCSTQYGDCTSLQVRGKMTPWNIISDVVLGLKLIR